MSISIKGSDTINGATSTDDEFTHVGSIHDGLLCSKPMDNFMLTYSEISIDCPECERKLRAGERQ